MPEPTRSRREILKLSALAGAGLIATGPTYAAGTRRSARFGVPGEKLKIGCIGVGGRGFANLQGVKNEEIVALCDVDDRQAARAYQQFPNAKKYYDYRKLLDELHGVLDAVVISTPDHSHALPAMIAMDHGLHVYCEKPLTHDVWEARKLAEMAAETGVATQMGNQGTSSDGFRKNVEILRSGLIGEIREAHVWTNRPVWPQGMDRPTEKQEIPPELKWDLWLGTAPDRPYHQSYLPFNWRGWWDFGTGALGDMGCHTANMAFMGLQLGSPISAQAENSGFSRDSFPTWSVITLNFPSRGELPPVRWTWYDGANQKPAWVNEKIGSLLEGEEISGSGSLLIGSKGKLYSPNDYGTEAVLLPREKFEGVAPPEPTLPRSPGHHAEWIAACKGGPPALSNFAYAGPLTETLLLGNVAMYSNELILWDPSTLEITSCPEANALIRRKYRKGWQF
jgi:predicted dehydrogenase